MSKIPFPRWLFTREKPLPSLLRTVAVILAFAIGLIAQDLQPVPRSHTRPIPPEEFSRLVAKFSEEGGFFLSDNFISNETSYLHVVDKLRELGASGGAYLGVGPEQNFTYIAKIRPRIAFIVDIRRQAMVQQLMYKALFQVSENRFQFLSRLFSKPMARRDFPGPNAPLPQLLEYLDRVPSQAEVFKENLALLQRVIQKTFKYPLSARDASSLTYVYNAFRIGNLKISFRFGGRGMAGGFQYGRFPSMRDILLETNLHGEYANFLAREQDYAFVRDLQRHNRVIPIVGDFAGDKALAAVANYLKQNGYNVTTFYVSNVEQFLFGSEVFAAFVENVRKLPVNEKSLFIRAFTGLSFMHPARVPGHRLATTLQKMTVFLDDYDHNRYPDYRSLLTTHFISGKDF
ncbi:MAG: hypothetical protein HY315_07065 [Acidobacteria bacterium]|nr:hypothetical protein [Acidobacteriota bacterium]